MRLLTLENNSFDINILPETVEDLRFCVLDNSDNKDPDYFFVPLVFLESFSTPALVLRIGQHHIKMPLDWHVVIGDSEHGDLEAIPLSNINDRGFSIFCFNPLTSSRPTFLDVEILDVFTDQKWFFPKLKNGQYLAVPLSNGENPLCAYFVKDITRNSEVIQYSLAW
jgi:hypothetical protein